MTATADWTKTFGSDGKATAEMGGDGEINDGALQPDGKIIVTGFATNQINVSNVILARFDSIGALTSILVRTVWLRPNIPAASIRPMRWPCSPTASRWWQAPRAAAHYAVYSLSRYNLDGSPDEGFGVDGVAFTTIQWRGGHGYTVAIQPDEKIVVAGDTYDGVVAFGFGLARFNGDGSLDTRIWEQRHGRDGFRGFSGRRHFHCASIRRDDPRRGLGWQFYFFICGLYAVSLRQQRQFGSLLRGRR